MLNHDTDQDETTVFETVKNLLYAALYICIIIIILIFSLFFI